jgi:hypothetical protein
LRKVIEDVRDEMMTEIESGAVENDVGDQVSREESRGRSV